MLNIIMVSLDAGQEPWTTAMLQRVMAKTRRVIFADKYYFATTVTDFFYIRARARVHTLMCTVMASTMLFPTGSVAAQLLIGNHVIATKNCFR